MVLVHYMRGPKHDTTEEMSRDDFMAIMRVSPYEVIDAYIKDDTEHYDVGYVGSLTWDNTTT